MKENRVTAPQLQSQRLLFRDIAEDDTDFIVKLRSDPNVYRFFCFPHALTKEEHLNWYLNRYVYDQNRFDWIALSSAGTPVGIFGVSRENAGSEEAEVSYMVAPEKSGHGYASEAVERLIDFCRDEWSCRKAVAQIHRENSKSIRFAERSGFQKASECGNFLRYERYI